MNLSKIRRIIVAGDSVFDNEPYVGSGRPVANFQALASLVRPCHVLRIIVAGVAV